DLGLRALLIEKESEFGGQLLWTFNPVNNYLGVDAENGRAMRDRFLESVENKGFQSRLNATIERVDLSAREITMADGSLLRSGAIIIATGVRRRTLGVPGEIEFRGRGMIESGVKDLSKTRNKIVAVVGGGDAALENALMMSEVATKVFVIHRGSKFSGRDEFISRVENTSNIEIHFHSRVSEIFGRESVEGIRILSCETAKASDLAVDSVLVRIGVVPNSDKFLNQIATDSCGYILIDSNCGTDIPGIFAIGDVASPTAPTIANAVGQGSVAAKFIAQNR
ncbi:MAG: FAD-dependent oxidoreductase, partial [Pyrinomonadaceae bacterium]